MVITHGSVTINVSLAQGATIAGLNAEIAAREAEDLTLQGNIDTEAVLRVSGDNYILSENITFGGTKTFTLSPQILSSPSAIYDAANWGFIKTTQDYINIKDFYGAKTDGTNTITEIKAAINDAEILGKGLFFPPGSYTIKGQMYLKNIPICGVPRKTKIIIESDFAFTETIAGRNYSCILSNDFQGQTTAFANEINIYGIDFDFRLLSSPNGDPNLLGLANVKKGNIENCHFKINAGLGSTVKATAIDLWACVKNLNIRNCKVENLNESTAGGCIWIRNITNSGATAANDVDNIVIDNCYLTSATKDEPLAVYGVQGVTKNIVISNTYVEGLTSSQDRSVLVSVFPLNNGSSQGQYASINNVRIYKCNFKDYFFSSHVLRIGQSSDTSNYCDNVTIEDCYFDVLKAVSGTGYCMRNIKNQGNNIKAIHNSINVDTTGQSLTYGISGFDKVFLNYLKGKIGNGIDLSVDVSNNKIDDIPGIGVINCETVYRNNIKTANHCVLINTANLTYQIDNNILENTPTTATNTVGIYIQSFGGLNPASIVSFNQIKMNYIGNYALRKEGTGGFRLYYNFVNGNGDKLLLTNPTTSTITFSRGNTWYGVPEVNSLTDAATISVIAALGTEFRVTLAGNRTMGNPTAPFDGHKIRFRIKQDTTGSRTLAWGTAYRFSSTFPSPTLSTSASSVDIIEFIYNSVDLKWDCVGFTKGII